MSSPDARIRDARTYTLQQWAAQAENGAERWRRQVPTGYLAAAMNAYLETRAAILAELERRGSAVKTCTECGNVEPLEADDCGQCYGRTFRMGAGLDGSLTNRQGRIER